MLPPGERHASSRPSKDHDVSTFARHQLWLARPQVRITVDHRQDALIVAFYDGPPSRELDPGEGLSAAFDGAGDDVLMTSLALLGLGRWAQEPIHDDIWTARTLLGLTVREAVEELLAPPAHGEVTGTELSLEPAEAELLARTWRHFVLRYEADHDPAGPEAQGPAGLGPASAGG